MALVQQILYGSMFFIGMGLLATLLLPLERAFPRISAHDPIWRRIRVILVMALCGVAAIQLWQFWLQESAISAFLRIRLFSLSKMDIPDWLLVVASLLILDFANWLFHWLSHKVKPLWRIHAVHHADEHVTAFSVLLHHPLESLAVAFFLMLFAVTLGIPVILYFAYGVTVALHSTLVHADIAVPQWLDRVLRWLLVTPDVHRIHHSQDMREGNSNFGSVLTIWDRMFGTYVAEPAEAPDKLSMGLPPGERPDGFTARSLLLLPFRRRRRA